MFRKLPRLANITERLILQHNVVEHNCETPTVLEYFKNLQYLEIRIMFAPIGISRLPPSVRTLVILNNVTYPPKPVLRHLGHVEHLRDYSFLSTTSSLSCNLINFLPLGSSSTLSTFTFDQPHWCDVEPDFDLFDTFVSLESLNLIDCSNGFFVYLQQSRLQLESLSLTWNRSQRIDEVTIATALRVSSAVQKLKHLSFSIPAKVYTCYGDLLKLWEPLILAITRLPYLEDLKLGLPIYTESCRHFENCSRIQTILWTIPESLRAGDVHVLTKALSHLDPEPSVSFAIDSPTWGRELNDRDSDEEDEWDDEEGEDEDESEWPGEWWGEEEEEEEEEEE